MYNLSEIDGGICAVEGFFANGIHAGLKADNALDFAFLYSDSICDIASIFTTNSMQAAPLLHAKGVERSNFICINAKNANAMTGQAGLDDVLEILAAITTQFPQLHHPLMSSTGVIGERLPKAKLIEAASTNFDLTKKEPHRAAQAIMTTDRFSKEIAVHVTLENGEHFRIGAMAKGAGMINPAMATMLCFITTDIGIERNRLQSILERVNRKSFNAASVDGDTSTNDSVFIFNKAQSTVHDEIAFEAALEHVMLFLAKALVRDGEGATKLVTYDVTGAQSDDDAEHVAKALSNSLLIKTALYGEDPNWGRIAMSIGASCAKSDAQTLRIAYEDVVLYENGENLFNTDVETAASLIMKQDAFTIFVDLGLGNGAFKAYGCDLGHTYVNINADYRT